MNALDWAIVGAYLVFVFVLGSWFARKERTSEDFFLAGRSMPAWAAAVSLLATSLSAVTFLGAPQEAYSGDLTYLSTNIGTVLGMLVVAFLFIPAFYKARVTTVYDLVGVRLGSGSARGARLAFMLGRVFASGARLYVASIPLSLIVFGDLALGHLVGAIAIVALVACVYTMLGGISAVIWTDAAQMLILLSAAALSAWLLLGDLPQTSAQIADLLADARTDDGASKLTLFDTSLDLSRPFTLPAVLIGFTLFSIAAYGTDQDLAQRMLTCKSSVRATAGMVGASLAGLVVTGLFLGLGLLLWVKYTHTEAAAPEDTRRIYLHFILTEMPAGLRGLMIAGLLAAAMSSLDSALNALASTSATSSVAGARRAVVAWAVALAGFAMLCAWAQKGSDTGIIPFALGVMTYAYAGLLGVFLTALLTNRGNTTSSALALITGFVIVGALQFGPRYWTDWGVQFAPSFAWRMTFASAIAFVICAAGRRSRDG